jgi:hypothetical protein
MRTLAELLATPDGRAFLAGRGVHVEAEDFLAAMTPPARPGLARALGLPDGARLPFTGQQTQCDYGASVVAKFRLLSGLTGPDVAPVTLPLDTDRAGSNRWNTTLVWPGEGKDRSVRLVPNRLAEVEMRFTPVEPAKLDEVEATVRRWGAEGDGADPERLDGFAAALHAAGTTPTLAEVNRSLTAWLLREGLGTAPAIALVSELLDADLLRAALDPVVAAIDDVIVVFNQALEGLVAADVDPRVRPLAPDYLPLWFSCPTDGKRCRLVRERRGADSFAVGRCRFCGGEHAFHLGSRTLTIDEVAATGRWSTDVTLPLYVNGLVSGVVAGQSTALYGLILDEVVRKVLAEVPIPMLVPLELAEVPDDGHDSFLHACLTRR